MALRFSRIFLTAAAIVLTTAVVMAAQQDLVDIVAQFDPRVVKMCGDGSEAED